MSFIVGVTYHKLDICMWTMKKLKISLSACAHVVDMVCAADNRMCCSLGGYEQIPCIMILIGVTKSRRITWTGHVPPVGEKSYMYRVLLRQPKGNKPLARSRSRWSCVTGFTLFRIRTSESLL